MRQRNTEHDTGIIEMFYEGRTFKEIGAAFNISQGWVYQICKRHGLSRKGPRYYPDTDRIEEAPNGTRRISWSRQMIDDLRRMFPDHLNQDIAEFLGVSPRTVVRKARELDLKKDDEWLRKIWDDRMRQAHMVSRLMGYPGAIQPGEHRGRETEFKKRTGLTAI